MDFIPKQQKNALLRGRAVIQISRKEYLKKQQEMKEIAEIVKSSIEELKRRKFVGEGKYGVCIGAMLHLKATGEVSLRTDTVEYTLGEIGTNIPANEKFKLIAGIIEAFNDMLFDANTALAEARKPITDMTSDLTKEDKAIEVQVTDDNDTEAA